MNACPLLFFGEGFAGTAILSALHARLLRKSDHIRRADSLSFAGRDLRSVLQRWRSAQRVKRSGTAQWACRPRGAPTSIGT